MIADSVICGLFAGTTKYHTVEFSLVNVMVISTIITQYPPLQRNFLGSYSYHGYCHSNENQYQHHQIYIHLHGTLLYQIRHHSLRYQHRELHCQPHKIFWDHIPHLCHHYHHHKFHTISMKVFGIKLFIIPIIITMAFIINIIKLLFTDVGNFLTFI